MAHWSLDRSWKAEIRCIMKEYVQLEHLSYIYIYIYIKYGSAFKDHLERYEAYAFLP